MTTQHRRRGSEQHRDLVQRHFLAWFVLLAVVLTLAPPIVESVIDTTVNIVTGVPRAISGLFQASVSSSTAAAASGAALPQANGALAPLFTDEIDHWSGNLAQWSQQYNLDTNLMATVMQIESCGHPNISSSAGAQGLFQVMPFHFGATENQVDPDTNARRSASVLTECLRLAENDPGMAMACYNGGPSVLSRPYSNWSAETQRYHRWGTGIYGDAVNGSSASPTLDAWLQAGGSGLCSLASDELGLN